MDKEQIFALLVVGLEWVKKRRIIFGLILVIASTMIATAAVKSLHDYGSDPASVGAVPTLAAVADNADASIVSVPSGTIADQAACEQAAGNASWNFGMKDGETICLVWNGAQWIRK